MATELSAAIVGLLKEAFAYGFGSPETYNDTLLNSADEAWAKHEADFTKAAAALAAPPVEQQAAVAKPLTDEDAGLLEQAATMLELQSIDLRGRGHDSEAAGAECSADAVRRLAVTLLRAETATAQWWLARLDQYGNPTLVDGAHSARSGADQAMYLINAMKLADPGARYAVARVDLSEPEPNARGVNHEAVAIINAAQPAPQAGAAERRPSAADIEAWRRKATDLRGCNLSSISRHFVTDAARMLEDAYLSWDAHPTEQPSQDAAWQKIGDEVALILSDPDSELSRGAKRALYWIAARAAQAQGEKGKV